MPNIPFPRDFPFSIEELRNEFNRLMDRAWHAGLTTAPLDGQDWAPAMEVIDEGASYRIRLEIPGLTAEDVDVTILEGTLTVKGAKAACESRDDTHRVLRSECRFGSFCRTYRFPDPVDEDSIKATCRYGVLEVCITKVRPNQGRSVKIESQD